MRLFKAGVSLSLLLSVALLLSATATQTEAKVLMGVMSTEQNYVYLGKFSFDTKGDGYLYFDSANVGPEADMDMDYITLNFYNDEEGKPWNWHDVWDNADLSCQQKVNRQHPVSANGGAVIDGSDIEFQFSDDKVITWYFTVSDCALDEGAELEMSFHMHFVNAGSAWISEFSVEDQNLLTIFFIFFLVWLVAVPLFFGAIFFFVVKQSRELDYVLKMFMVVVTFQWMAVTCLFAHYTIYAIDGIGIPSMHVTGDVLLALSYMLFMIVLLHVVSERASPIHLHVPTWVICGSLLFLYLVFFLWQEIYPGMHPESDHYRWNIAPGIVMILIQVLVWIYFLGMAVFRATRSENRLLLLIVAVVFSFWFLCLPFIVSLASLWSFFYRNKWVVGITWTVNSVLFATFALLAIPSPVSDRLRSSSAFSKPSYNTDIIPNRLVEDDDDPFGGL